jgi:Spy/CpxP family protein refolding chaperone
MGMPFWMMGQYGAGMYGMGAGMGTGMIGGSYPTVPGQIPGLTPEQEQKLSRLQQESMEGNSSLAQQFGATQDKLNLLLMNEKRDWNAIRAASQHLFDIQRQQLDSNLDLQQKTDGLLTDSQRKDMARAWRGYGWTGSE